MSRFLKSIKPYAFEIVFFSICFIFTSWLMISTFSYQDGQMLIASKAWSDFASHIPLIRSFSFGWNFPPEYPLFAGEPTHYHFLFYAFVGLLERLGVRIDYALNAPSIIGFFSLLVLLYFFSKNIFKSKAIAILSVLFFLFNGSLSFLYFVQKHPFSQNFINTLITSTTFSSFHPYGDGLVSAFWNLNIYTNQRHLAAAFAFSLAVLYLFLLPVFKKAKGSISLSLLLGLVLGLSYFFHIAVFAMTCIVVLIFLSLFSKIRNSGIIILGISALISYPQYHYMNTSSQTFHTVFKLGYLNPNPLTIFSFMNYWSLNLGLHLILIPIGFIFAGKTAKKIFIAFFVFFIVGNLFQFSTEMAANHKFFNYFMLIGNMFSAFVLVSMWKRSIYLKPLVVALSFFLILSGVIDFFPVYNDSKLVLRDSINSDIQWIKKNTPQNAIFLNTSYLYTPESLAGRKILMGWPYFAWSQGYDTFSRSLQIKNTLSSNNKFEMCNFMERNLIDYISTTTSSEDFPFQNEWFEKNLKAIYKNPASNLIIYAKKDNC